MGYQAGNRAVDGSDAVKGRMSGLRARCPGCRAVCPGSGSVDELDEHRVECSNPGQNSEDFVDGNWGKARSTCNTRNPRIKSNKTSSHQQITKKIGAIFVGQFSD